MITHMSISIFLIPHLREEIALNLLQHDITQCALVSKDWNTWFSPTLWFKPRFKNAVTASDLAKLTHHRNSVRSILNLRLTKTLEPSGIPKSFPRLQSIEFSFEQSFYQTMVDVALSIVNETPTLESLTLSIPRLYGQGQLAWTLMSHKRLRRFTFKISPEVYPDSLQEIVEACSKLEYLCIDTYHQSPPSPYSSYSTDSITRSAVAKKRYENMQDTKIRDLSIDLNHEDLSHNLLISILERCPLLETLWLGGKYKRTTLKDVSDIFERGVCPLLKNVNIEGICETTHTPDELGAFVRSIGSNGRDDIEDDRFGTRGLESLSIFEGAKFGRPTVLALTQYHSKTLTNLMWPHFIPLGISLFGDLLKDLPRLKTLKARVWLNLRVKDGPDMDPVFRKEWNCPELSNLEIDLGLSATFDKTTDQAWSGSLSDRSMSYALSQIAKLKKLKKLVVRSEVELLTLKGPGYLRMLSGLKQLEVLRFDRWSTSDMHAEEAEWMIENWPELISIIPEWRWIPKKSPGSRGKPYDEFTQTLVDLRPRLSID